MALRAKSKPIGNFIDGFLMQQNPFASQTVSFLQHPTTSVVLIEQQQEPFGPSPAMTAMVTVFVFVPHTRVSICSSN